MYAINITRSMRLAALLGPVQAFPITAQGAGVYAVTSLTSPKITYTVRTYSDFDHGDLALCTCPDFENRSHVCKHMRAVFAQVATVRTTAARAV